METNLAEENELSVDCDRGGGRGIERVTVNLTPRSVAALNLAASLTGDTRTDTINRALQVHAYLEQLVERGGSVHVRYSEDAELALSRVHSAEAAHTISAGRWPACRTSTYVHNTIRRPTMWLVPARQRATDPGTHLPLATLTPVLTAAAMMSAVSVLSPSAGRRPGRTTRGRQAVHDIAATTTFFAAVPLARLLALPRGRHRRMSGTDPLTLAAGNG